MVRDRRSPVSHPTWRMAVSESDSLTSDQAATLELIAQLPLASTAHLVPLAGPCDRSTLCRKIGLLVERGLIATLDGPAYGRCRPRQLLLITNLGLAVLAWRRGVDPCELVRQWGLGRRAIEALIGQLPAVFSIYQLLALLAGARSGWTARLLTWHRPWLSPAPLAPAGSRRVRGVRLPAYAVLEWHSYCGQRLSGRCVLVADTGSLPPLAFRSALAQLAQAHLIAQRTTPLVAIATTSHRRLEAWSAVLDSIAGSHRGGPLESCISTWDTWQAEGVALPWTSHSGAGAGPAPPPMSVRPDLQGRPWSDAPRPIDLGRVRAAVREWDISGGARAALDVIGRHSFLSTTSLGEVLGRDSRWARERRRELVQRGLVRVPASEELPPNLDNRDELLEATVRGLRILAASMGLSLALAERYHGLTGGGPASPIGPRRALFAHLAHTLGADEVFVRIARAARGRRNGSLLEWRNAAACAAGRVRPDGYGLLRLGSREYGFIVEFDRGTIHPAALRAKFAAYGRFMPSARAARDYDGFPNILVVTTGPAGEQRIVDAIRAVSAGEGSRLPALVTTVEWLESNGDGPFGCIWLEADSVLRRSWPGTRSR